MHLLEAMSMPKLRSCKSLKFHDRIEGTSVEELETVEHFDISSVRSGVLKGAVAMS